MKLLLQTIQISIGTPPQIVNLHLDTMTNYTIIPQIDNSINSTTWNYFQPSTSTSFQSFFNNDFSTFLYKTTSFQAMKCQDNFNFNNGIMIKNYNFLLVNYNKTQMFTEGSFGLAIDYTWQNKYSLLNILTNGNLQYKKVFRINYRSNNSLVIGDVLNSTDYSRYTFCNNNYYNGYWSCNLSHIIYFNNNSQFKHNSNDTNKNDTKHRDRPYFTRHSSFMNKSAIFDTSLKMISLPGKMYKEFFEFYFEELYEDNCNVVKNGLRRTIICNNITNLTNFTNSLNYSLTIVLNGIGYILNNSNLFDETPLNSGNYTLNIDFVDNLDTIYLGSSFLRNFDVVFDYQNQSIGLISYDNNTLNYTGFTRDTSIFSFLNSRRFWRIFEIIILALVLILIVVIIFYRRYKIRTEMSSDYREIDNRQTMIL